MLSSASRHEASSRMPTMARRYPSWESFWLTANPIPRVAPVTTATFLMSNSFVQRLRVPP